jgi:hypothetical protein
MVSIQIEFHMHKLNQEFEFERIILKKKNFGLDFEN